MDYDRDADSSVLIQVAVARKVRVSFREVVLVIDEDGDEFFRVVGRYKGTRLYNWSDAGFFDHEIRARRP